MTSLTSFPSDKNNMIKSMNVPIQKFEESKFRPNFGLDKSLNSRDHTPQFNRRSIDSGYIN